VKNSKSILFPTIFLLFPAKRAGHVCQDFLKWNYCNSRFWSFNSHLLSFKSQ